MKPRTKNQERRTAFSCLLASALCLAGCQTLPVPAVPQPTALAPVKIKAPAIPAATKTIVLKAPIVLTNQTFDGKFVRYVADPDALGDGSQAEGQKPLFILKGNSTLKNVILDKPAADGVHCQPGPKQTQRIFCVHFLDIGEDAISILSGDASSKVEIADCTFRKAQDKVIQANAPTHVHIWDCYAEDFQRFSRGCGTCGNKPYWIEVRDLTAKNGDSVLKLTNPLAFGRIVRGNYQNVARLGHAENKAEIVIVK